MESKITTGIFLTVTTAIAYLAYYFYELGFLGAFNVPMSFIGFSKITIFLIGSLVFCIAIFIFTLGLWLLSDAIHRKNLLILHIFVYIISSLFLLSPGIIAWIQGDPSLAVATAVIVLVFFFILFLITKNKNTSIQQYNVHHPIALARKLFGVRSDPVINIVQLLFLIVVIATPFLSFTIGGLNGITRDTLLITEKYKGYVIVRVYDDKVVLVKYNASTKQFEKVYKIDSIEKLGELSIIKK